jgi:sarcosine oxidase, subunit gamma
VTADPVFDAGRRRSPLDGFDFPAGIREVPFLAQVDVRADPADVALMARLAGATGGPLPPQPNTVAGDPAGVHALWLGPDEWLVVGPPRTEGHLEDELREAIAGAHGSVVDVSANRTVVEVSGPAAHEALEGGCSIDLDRRAFGPGQCAQTLVARANVILHQAGAEPSYRIFVRPSFAIYLATWLKDALAASR